MGKKSKSKSKKSGTKKSKSATAPAPEPPADRDPPIQPLTEEEKADVPALLDTTESPFRPVRRDRSMDLSSLGAALGVTVMVRPPPTPHSNSKQCVACTQDKPKEDFSHSQWTETNNFGPRCLSCVQNGRFRVVDPERYWIGWPKDPMQVLWERGWIDCPRGQKPDPARYASERLGRMVIGMPDSDFLLATFEQGGHCGYGGVDEELCCMPGCVMNANLKACSRCRHARYCCEEHQALHYRHHKDQCMAWSKTETGGGDEKVEPTEKLTT